MTDENSVLPCSDVTDYDALIARIEEKAKEAGVTLAAGVSEEEIAAAEEALGQALPDAVKAFYRRHDGAVDFPAVEWRELLSLQRMVQEWRIWKELFDEEIFGGVVEQPEAGVQDAWWIPAWIPVTYDGSGNHHMLDLAPGPGGRYGQILSFWEDDPRRTVVGESFLTWLATTTWGALDEDDARDAL
jgi:cell wall assembly regulator SMI1